MKRIFVFLCILFWFSVIWGQNQQTLQQGIESYNNHEYYMAKNIFSQLLSDGAFASNDTLFYYWVKSKMKTDDQDGLVNIVNQLLNTFPDSKLIKQLAENEFNIVNTPVSNVNKQSTANIVRNQNSVQYDFPREKQPKISNVFYETDLRQALQDISTQAGIPILTDNSVQGFITLELDNVVFEDALRRVLAVGGFSFKRFNDYYLVGAVDPANPTFSLLSSTQAVIINYIPAVQAVSLLSDFYQAYVKADQITNSVIISASQAIISKVIQDLKVIDQKPRQVMIEAVITEINENALKNIGIDWSVFADKGDKNFQGNVNLATGMIDTLNALVSLIRNETTIIKNTPVNIITSVRAIAEDGNAEIKANPKIVTTNAQPANIYIAQEQYYSLITGPITYPYTKLEQVSVGIKLEITPFISDNDEITVQIQQEVSDAVAMGREGLPMVDRRNVSTTVRVKDGETITIGGLTQHSTRKIQNKIPLLGSIPLLGYFFSHTKYENHKTDVVVFITPHIL